MNVGSDGSTTFSTTFTYDSANHPVNADCLAFQFFSPWLAAQTIASQTLSLQVQALETRTANNLFVSLKVYLVDKNGSIRAGGTILALTRDNTVLTTTSTNRSFTGTTSSVTCLDGDRIVFELGFGGTPTAGGSGGHNAAVSIGEDVPSDLPVDDTTTALQRPWLQFTNTLTFLAPETRDSQDSFEILFDYGEGRISQDSFEILFDYGEGRVSQDSFEILYDEGVTGETRISEESFEVLYDEGAADSGSRLSQESIEVLYDETQVTNPETHISMDSIEILYDQPPPTPPPPGVFKPDAQVATARTIVGQTTVAQIKAGQISGARVIAGQVN